MADKFKFGSADLEAEGEDVKEIAHTEAMEIFRETMGEVIMSDPLLVDLPPEPTLEEINSQIALEYGRAILINVRQLNETGTLLPVVVVQNASVYDLKKAVERHVTVKQEREDGATVISWRSIWKTYWLVFEGQKLAEDHRSIKEYGIRNKDEVTFVKRLRPK